MKKIVLVDDDFDLSDTIKSVLEYGGGYQVLVSNEPKQGIEVIKKIKPDLILMDVILPGMNGAEAVKILKSNSATMNIPVIFLTGLLSGEKDDLQENAINVSGERYATLAKPFENERLLKMVKDALNDS